MASFESPVKLDPSNLKRKEKHFMGQMHRLSTRFTWAESNMRDVGKSSFVEAMSTRKDSVFEKVIQELTCLENVYSTDVKIVYHLSCFRSYTSKRNCRVFKVEHNLLLLLLLLLQILRLLFIERYTQVHAAGKTTNS